MIEINTVIPIPVPISPLIGRDLELAHLCELATGDARLVTITGIGGIGKTRLATHVALEMEPFFEHGAVLVPLSQVREAEQIAETIGSALGQRFPPGDVDATAVALGEGTRLLVLDNLEQIPNAGEFLSQLLAAHVGITLLATSQVPLRITSEQVYTLGPMTVPATNTGREHLQNIPSVRLFMQRAQFADSDVTFDDADLAIVAEICSRLEGIPLAIELAAARLVALPPAALLERLGNRFDILGGGSPHADQRLRTMRNAVAWSYDLLAPDDQRIFRYLGVYAGNISIEAVQHTLSTLELTTTPWELIESFLSRSLLQKTHGGNTPCYRMLQTLRDFALEQLEVEGAVFAAHLSHASWVVDLAEEAEDHIRGEDQAHWFQILKTESDNIRAATGWAATHRPEYVMRMIAAIWKYFEYSGSAEHYSTLGISLDTSTIPDHVLATGFLGIGGLYASTYRDPERALETLRQAVSIAEQLGDDRTMGRAHNAMGAIERNRGNVDISLEHYQKAVVFAKRANNLHDLAAAMGNVALNAFDRNDIPAARASLEAVLPVAEQTRSMAMISRMRLNLGAIANRLGDFESARTNLLATLKLARETGNSENQYYALLNLVNAELGLENVEKAASHVEECLELAQQMGNLYHEAAIRTTHLDVLLHQGDLDAVAEQITLICAAAENESFPDVLVTAAGLAMNLAYRQNRLETAAALLGGFTALQEKTSTHVGDRIEGYAEVILANIPEDPKSDLRIAYQNGKQWDYEELRVATSRAAYRYRRHSLHLSPPPKPVEIRPKRTYQLTSREYEVLSLLSSGKSNIDIANEMFISHRTISTHVSNILGKLNVPNRAAAVALALSEGLVSP